MILALLYDIPLDDVIEYVIKHTEPYNKYTLRLKNEKIIREYATVKDDDVFLTYNFNFENSNVLLNVSLVKKELFEWYKIKSRIDKIKKIKKHIDF